MQHFAAVLLVSLAAASPVAAQQRPGSLRVTVEDPTGAVLVGATVELSGRSLEPVVRTTDAQGRATFESLPPGNTSIRVSSPGFDDHVHPSFLIRSGQNGLSVKLQLAGFEDTVVVTRDPSAAATDPQGDTLAVTLGSEELDALPDSPDDLEQILTELAGPDAEITVDGFREGPLPSKDRIQEIRVRRAVYSADNHSRGGSRVEIVTRPGTEQWESSIALGYRDDSMNARNAFAVSDTAEQDQRLSANFDGPLVKNRTSMSVEVEGESSYESRTVRALGLAGPIQGLVRQPEDRLGISARLNHALSRTHNGRLEYQHRRGDQDNLGVGDFDLPERAYSRRQTSNRLRLGSNAAPGNGVLNELRLQFEWEDSRSAAVSNAPTIRVLDTVTRGGANIRGGRDERMVELNEKLDVRWRTHAVAVGAQLNWFRYHSDEIRDADGTFTFSSLTDLDAGRPQTFTQRRGDPTVAYSMFQGAWFVQDDVRIRKNLTIGIGVRHEWQSHLDDWWNVAPRFGFMWSPGSAGSTAVRGGVGVFHDWYDASTYQETLQVDGIRLQELTIENPGFPDPFSGGTAVEFPTGHVQQATDLRMPTIRQATVAVEQRVGRALRLNAGYTLRDGTDLLRGRNVNAPGADGERPDPGTGNVIEIRSIGHERQHRVSLGLNARLPWRRLFVNGRYDWEHLRDDGDGSLSLPADHLSPDEWGPSGDDVRHSFFALGSLELLRNLQLGLNVRTESATPYNVTTGRDDNGDGEFNDRPAGLPRNAARGDGMMRFDVRLSYRVGAGRPGMPSEPERRQQGRGRGDDGGGSWRSRHRMMAEFYVRALNVLNTVNPQGFSGVQTSPFFGRPTSAQPARRIELGTRFMF